MASKKQIRKKFESVLKAAVLTYEGANPKDPPIWWPGVEFSDSGRDFYLRPMMMWGPETARDIGPNPQTKMSGIFKVGVFVRAALSSDPLDDLVEIVETAYPFGTDLHVGGRQVQVDRRTAGDILQPPGWSYRSVDINWSIGV